ncbi:ArnT family glycosyltransferase [Bradyrhizobium canariense]|uniref:Dolichyl-phosphate-mannose-protein mannosyltransferase n=1 Tax=Bradyrhizobium canariense TaxID=255045 RepID=A0A1H1RVN3_9BRAD|nr:glycosyltransferase family 39 protein [Bradyrhizobium canariense]SDS39831.1 Dolichyl-phosphate-mannose-protein mannosyltransferase [Bradyrhizobium canariense]
MNQTGSSDMVVTPRLPVTASIKAAFSRQPVVWLVALLVAIVHAATAGRYDAQRNELYFLVCGWHPDFGYVDQPPLVPLIAAATQIFGINIWLLRLPATIVAVGLVLLCAAFARLLGGESRAASLAAIAAGIAPGLAALGSHLTTSTFEPIAWTAAAFLLARAVLRDTRSDLIWIGVLVGAAMEAKWGIAVWLVALGIGVVATPARKIFFWWQLWLGIAVAAVLFAPNLIWQWQHGWPFFEVILPHLDSQKNFTGPFWKFELDQALSMNVVLAPLWLAGVAGPFIDRRLADARWLSLAFVLATAFYFLQRGTNYYLFPAYPTMFAVGAVWCERLAAAVTRIWITAALGFSALVAPIVLPILEPSQLQRYMEIMHIKPRPIEAAGVGAPLTQSLSDEFGWRDLENKVAAVFHRLSPEDQARAAILTANYGEAAALDVFGGKDGLPPALSGQNQYWLWGPRSHDGSLIIHVGGDAERWRRICGSIEDAGSFGNPYAMPYENDRAIFICRDTRAPLDRLWNRLKRFR